jgi:hypothetical protein
MKHLPALLRFLCDEGALSDRKREKASLA